MTTAKKNLIQQVVSSAQTAQKRIATLSSQQKTKLEKAWDVEHAYYSSALEGSKLDREEFDKLAETLP